MGKHRVIPCTPPADPDALLVDDATAREHIDTLRDVTTEIARTVAGLDGRATPHDVQQKLAAVLAGYYGTLLANGFTLRKRHGVGFLVAYVAFVAYSVAGVWWADLYGVQEE